MNEKYYENDSILITYKSLKNSKYHRINILCKYTGEKFDLLQSLTKEELDEIINKIIIQVEKEEIKLLDEMKELSQILFGKCVWCNINEIGDNLITCNKCGKLYSLEQSKEKARQELIKN